MKVSIPVTWATTYSCVAGVALAQQVTITTATAFGTYASFNAQITIPYLEYRIERIALRIIPVPNISTAGLYIPAIYGAPFYGQAAPTPSISNISKIPRCLIQALYDRELRLHWNRTNDPEDKTYTDTTAACPVVGGVILYIGAAAPTASIPYLTIITTAVVSVRGRKI